MHARSAGSARARKLLTRACHLLADLQDTSTNKPLRRP